MAVVTHHPTAENHGHWWLTAWGNWRRLHAVPAAELTKQEHRDRIDQGEAIVRFTACGSRIALAVPGMAWRFGARRCVPCCKRLGIPTGRGTPTNTRDTLTVDIDVRVPDLKARTNSPFGPNAVTCPDCGEPYISEWIDISRCFVGNDGTTVSVGATHSPCPARPDA